MKVSEGAWHVTVVRRLDHDYRPRDLCSHFWTVQGALAAWAVFGLVIAAAIGAVITFVVWGFIVAPINVGWPWSGTWDGGWWSNVQKILYIVAYVLLLVSPVGWLIYKLDQDWLGGGTLAREERRLDRRRAKRDEERKKGPLPPPKPSLLLAFLRAKKRKVCPLIELVPEVKAA